MKKALLLFAAVLLTLSVSLVAANAAEEYVIKWPDTQPDGTSLMIYMRKAGDIIREKTGGRIGVEYFPASMMGPSPTVLQQVQMGALDIYRTDVSVLYDFGVESMKMLGLPYLFDSKAHAEKVLYGPVGDRFLKDVDDANLQFKAIGWLIEPARNMFLRNKKAETMADFAGLKIRVPESEIFLASMEAFGISGTPISMGEVYTSLQTGVVDGAENTIDTFNANRFDEVCDYISLTAHNFNTCVMVMSKMNWDQFSPEDQKAIVDSWKEAVREFDEFSVKSEAESMDLARSRGVEILNLRDKAKWIEAAQPLYAKYAAGYEDIVREINAQK